MIKKELLFEGKEKKIYATDDSDKVIIHYSDVTTAFGGIKRAVLKNKGKYNNSISSTIFHELGKAGIRTHYIETISDREQLCHKIELIPLQVIVRNRLAGTTAALLGVEEGSTIRNTIYELRYNNDALCDPMINEHHAVALGIVSYDEIHGMIAMAEKINVVLKEIFLKAGIELVDFKIEFGKASDGQIILSDEISPDNTRLWDIKTGEKLDKDRFRHDMSDVCASYKEVMDRLNNICK